MISVIVLSSVLAVVSASNFNQDFTITWGDGRVKILNNSQPLTLSLDKTSGFGFQSNNEYLFGKIDMKLKLAPRNSASTVTAYYMEHPLESSRMQSRCSVPKEPTHEIILKKKQRAVAAMWLTHFHLWRCRGFAWVRVIDSSLAGECIYTDGASLSTLFIVVSASNFYQDFDITWGDGRAKILNNGELLTLSLDKPSGSGFQSKNEYLFGKIDMQLKLVAGNSAGTVTAYYLSSQGSTHDEIDFEFLGNLSGDPYILHTNVFSQGKGNREQQFYLWFDPTADFHTYSVLWNPQRIIFSVDGTPIREFKNAESVGVPYPKNQPMRIYSSLWNADDWATRGGLVKTDWTQAPFTASYRNFNANACIWFSGSSSCSSSSSNSNAWFSEQLDSTNQERLKWVQKNYMIYNYCSDVKRFPQGLPPECNMS
ncbi:hypothetical protein TEA_027740 [Camellia sinensis var. sinensis]|uniref:xyloglucan:xyloglucosyl transferase n=1 Tax=Camellia sinensis var. sinensis TaxID=542762 RepID=A0A4V3WN45_CAMSN|nr:hypothetical protein TEA_027740 [Camellia sinensis var. sinensis]